MPEHDSPLDRIRALEGDILELRATDERQQHELLLRARDPVSPRLLALVMVLSVVIACTVLGCLRILPGEAIAGLVGALVGRLTSNIGSDSESKVDGK